jgi:hypothetical protein
VTDRRVFRRPRSATGYSLVALWGDSNRLTFYLAPLPRTDIPATAQMTGTVRWDPAEFPSANCSSFMVFTDVQTGPRPLLDSDGQHFGVAPTKRIGRFSTRASGGRTVSGGVSSCDYTISALAPNWFHNTSATTTAAPANSEGGSNPPVGNLHSAGYMHPVGWSGVSVIPAPIAANKDYEMLRGMAGSQALGSPRVVMPGQKETGIVVYGVDPAVPIRLQEGQTQGGPAPVIVNRLPTPPVPDRPRQPDSGSIANNAPSQPQPVMPPSQPVTQGHATAPGQAPISERPERTKIMETGKAPETVSPGAKSSINPQPLPPRIQQLPGRVAGSSTMGPGARIMINPQPLPPRQSNGTNGIR